MSLKRFGEFVVLRPSHLSCKRSWGAVAPARLRSSGLLSMGKRSEPHFCRFGWSNYQQERAIDAFLSNRSRSD